MDSHRSWNFVSLASLGRVAIATGTGDDQNVQDYLVPAGASFSADVPGITWINETAFTPEERKPLPLRNGNGTPKRQ